MGAGRAIIRLWTSRLLLFIMAVLLLIAVVHLRTGTVYLFAEQTEMERLMRRPPKVIDQYWSPAQYGEAVSDYLRALVTGNLVYTEGSGWFYGRRMDLPREPLWPLLAESWSNSFRLFALAFTIGTGAGILIGSLAAYRHRMLRGAALTLAVVGLSVPDFFVVLMGQFATIWTSRNLGVSLWPILSSTENLKMWIFPALVLAIAPAGYAIRLTSSALDEIMREDYIRTARGKGVPEARVILGHAFRNIIPRLAAGLPAMLNIVLSGLVVVEQLTIYPGLSKWMLRTGVQPITTAGIFFIAWFMLFDGLANTLRIWLNPLQEEEEL